MKKAAFTTGGKQYLVSVGDSVNVELLNTDKKTFIFPALLVLDGDNVQIGKPEVDGASVTAEITEINKQSDKVTSIRYKAKKRVHKVRGHRQHQAVIKITKIS